MARSTVLPTDPQARKLWSLKIAHDSIKESFFAKHTGGEGSSAILVRKTEMESGKGDEITTQLICKLVGAPITENEMLEGREMKLDFATHKMRINEYRGAVNFGSMMAQKRTDAELDKEARQRLIDWVKEVYEERIVCALAGTRGTGDEFKHTPIGYAGYPNALVAPDAKHLFVGTAGNKAKATLEATDKLALTTLNKLRTKAKKMLGGVQAGESVRMEPTRMGGKECFALVTMPEGLQDLREDSGTQGWFEAQKALTSAIGRDAEMFKGGAGYWAGAVVEECDTGVKFADYGASSNIPAMRSLYCGANAGVIANGTRGMTDGLPMSLKESSLDHGHQKVVVFEMVMGVDKATWTNAAGVKRDVGLISVDHAFTAAV